jgi:hypothetical protein
LTDRHIGKSLHIDKTKGTTRMSRNRYIQEQEDWDRPISQNILKLQQDDPTLKELWLFEITSAVGRALATNTHLRVLWLQNLILNERFVIDLANGIRQSKIEELNVWSPVFEDQSALWKPVCVGVQSSSTIRTLSLDFGNEPVFTSFDWLGKIISSLPTLQILHLHRIHSSAIGLVLSNHLSRPSSLTTLRLYSNVERIDIDQLLQILQNSSLTKLDLWINLTNSSDLQSLLDGWQPNMTIRSLCWMSSTFDCNGLKILLGAVASGRMLLQELDTSLYHGMRHVGYDGLQIIGEALPSLRSVTQVSLVLRGRDAPQDVRKKATRVFLEGLKEARQLRKLKFTGDHIFQYDEEISFYLSLIRHGRYLLASNHHGLASTVWCHIFGKCQGPHESSTIFYFLREQPSLVQPRRGRKRSRPVRYSPMW